MNQPYYTYPATEKTPEFNVILQWSRSYDRSAKDLSWLDMENRSKHNQFIMTGDVETRNKHNQLVIHTHAWRRAKRCVHVMYQSV